MSILHKMDLLRNPQGMRCHFCSWTPLQVCFETVPYCEPYGDTMMTIARAFWLEQYAPNFAAREAGKLPRGRTLEQGLDLWGTERERRECQGATVALEVESESEEDSEGAVRLVDPLDVVARRHRPIPGAPPLGASTDRRDMQRALDELGLVSAPPEVALRLLRRGLQPPTYVPRPHEGRRAANDSLERFERSDGRWDLLHARPGSAADGPRALVLLLPARLRRDTDEEVAALVEAACGTPCELAYVDRWGTQATSIQ